MPASPSIKLYSLPARPRFVYLCSVCFSPSLWLLGVVLLCVLSSCLAYYRNLGYGQTVSSVAITFPSAAHNGTSHFISSPEVAGSSHYEESDVIISWHSFGVLCALPGCFLGVSKGCLPISLSACCLVCSKVLWAVKDVVAPVGVQDGFSVLMERSGRGDELVTLADG